MFERLRSTAVAGASFPDSKRGKRLLDGGFGGGEDGECDGFNGVEGVAKVEGACAVERWVDVECGGARTCGCGEVKYADRAVRKGGASDCKE